MAAEQQGTAAALPGAWLPYGALERQAEWPAKGGEMIKSQAEVECDKLRAELRAAVDTLRLIGDNSESSYWELRHWLDSRPDCREWVHGDDGPAYPFMQLAQKARSLVAAYDAKHPEGE